MNEALTLPGVANAWSMPIRGRIDMLTTGIRTPIGVKISGENFATIEKLAVEVESVLRTVKGTRAVAAERFGEGKFVDFNWNRARLAQNGLTVRDAQSTIQYAIGGENVTTMVEGRERYPVNVRYASDFRDDVESLNRVLVSTADGERQIPVSELGEARITSGPSMLRNEDGLLTAYVYVDINGRDPQGYVEEAARLVREKVNPPRGYSIFWSGQYEAMERVKQRLFQIVPLTLLVVFLLLYLNTRSCMKTAIVLMAVPFSAAGAVWLVYLLGYQISAAVWVGMIALLGVDMETGVFMLMYLDQSYSKAKMEGRLSNAAGLREAVLEGAARRVRPKLMTAAAMFAGLMPIMWSTGAGSEIMKRIAAPMLGGIFTSFILELVVYPAIYYTWKWHVDMKAFAVRSVESLRPL
jgi:Cu(I)/Ag(I) efflux system membrane protein CusA/SilA